MAYCETWPWWGEKSYRQYTESEIPVVRNVNANATRNGTHRISIGVLPYVRMLTANAIT